ncbi:PQQ-dependent sugar dehydrogenase [Echinicola shivajiensis]|uniref:PQQ-dependent sugar dehydrogenase n=1 Tax=Echinicola shivajiensis TaxID=1035916 RepID=UPI001BFC67A5|nr:PQQ-dependent sugar dehydrogenase [Echinicola shivajiensis]
MTGIRHYLAFLSIILLISCQKESQEFQRTKIVDYVKLKEGSYLEVSSVAEGLDVPWGMDHWGNKIIFTEITGAVKQLDLSTGRLSTLLVLDDVFQKRTTGLLDIAIQKGKETNPYVLLNYTSQEGSEVVSNLVRYTYTGDALIAPKKLLIVRGYTGHNGARLFIDDQDVVYWATGDVADNTQAQDSLTLNGKILRLDINGGIPEDNPIQGSYVFSWGFRNMQGLTMDERGNIFTSEHGDAIEDEINLIQALHNYGWPLIEGKHDTTDELTISDSICFSQPIKSWTPVIAPAGLAHYAGDQILSWKNTLLLGTLKSQTFRVLSLNSERTQVTNEKVFFSDRYGRIRDVLVLPNGDVFISTSNRDWNPQPGFPLGVDDRILRIRGVSSIPNDVEYIVEDEPEVIGSEDGKVLYKNYCASCHKEDGKGVSGNFPPLRGSRRINNTSLFIDVLLNGTNGKEEINGVKYNQPMASFAFLKDNELSAIINYVNMEFGNGRQILTKEVTNYRKKD